MGFFWPTNVTRFPGAAARLGRALHYLSLVPVAYLVWLAFYGPSRGYSDYGVQLWGCLILAALVYLGGRVLRFFFAGE